MYDIRKIHEQILFDAIKNARNEEIAEQIVFGDENYLMKIELLDY